MFGSKKKRSEKSSDKYSENEPITSIIGKEMTVKGNLIFTGKARIDGKVEGDISGDSLVLSATALVVGNIKTKSLVNQGRVDGDVQADNLMIKEDGYINGKVVANDLFVESGSILNGEVKIKNKELSLVPEAQGSAGEATTQDLFQKAT